MSVLLYNEIHHDFLNKDWTVVSQTLSQMTSYVSNTPFQSNHPGMVKIGCNEP